MRNQNQSKLAALMATIFLAAAEALAQDQQQAASEEGEESKRRIVISIADRTLAVVEDGRVVKTYPTAVGADATPSPTGVFKIANRVPNPTWYGPHRKIVPPGKANPLGTRWMGLSYKGYNVSHGCIRMRKADVEQLFEIVKVGDVVEIVAGVFESAESADSGE
jgi:lipoprotein-anchoring transpeptidase ErfK/SrfK